MKECEVDSDIDHKVDEKLMKLTVITAVITDSVIV
jgi:hypothetical protein